MNFTWRRISFLKFFPRPRDPPVEIHFVLLFRYQKLTAREKTDYNKGETVVQETTEPAVKKPKLMEPFKKGQGR